MGHTYIIRKKIEASSLQEALRREKEGIVEEVFIEKKAPKQERDLLGYRYE